MSGSHVTGSKVTELLSCTNGVGKTGFTWSLWDQAAAFSSPEAKAEASICSVVKLCHCHLCHCYHALLSLLLFSLY